MKNSLLSPIIFCHYGMSYYLIYTLLAAKISNPQKKIYLLGDLSNQKLSNQIGINHTFFTEFDSTQSIIDFNKNFKFISGELHGRFEWSKFVFLRWFYINEFVSKNNINSFWHFDSDNLIVSDLSQFENDFSAYDNTEQCSGICMNGFISSRKITQLYTNHIIHLFKNNKYINEQKLKCKNNPTFAFTEMAAYNDFKSIYKLNTTRLHCADCQNTFDDCLASSDDMEQSSELYNGYKIKSIYIDKKNNFYFKNFKSKNYIKVNSFNLSWMPNFLIFRLFFMFYRSKNILFFLFIKLRKRKFYKIDFSTYSLFDRLIDKFFSRIIKLKF